MERRIYSCVSLWAVLMGLFMLDGMNIEVGCSLMGLLWMRRTAGTKAEEISAWSNRTITKGFIKPVDSS